jgi:hypothetical protein
MRLMLDQPQSPHHPTDSLPGGAKVLLWPTGLAKWILPLLQPESQPVQHYRHKPPKTQLISKSQTKWIFFSWFLPRIPTFDLSSQLWITLAFPDWFNLAKLTLKVSFSKQEAHSGQKLTEMRLDYSNRCSVHRKFFY